MLAYLEQFVVDEEPSVARSAPVHREVGFPKQTLKENDLFMVCDLLGNMPAGEITNELGLFCADTRYLSCLELELNGEPPVLLSGTADAGYQATLRMTNGSHELLPQDSLSINRQLVLCGGLFETITITNYATHALAVTLNLRFGNDFADIFEVRGLRRSERGKMLRPALPPPPDQLVLAYLGLDKSLLETRIHFGGQPPRITGTQANWSFILHAHQEWKITYRADLLKDGEPASYTPPPATFEQAQATAFTAQQSWRNRVTCISADNRLFNEVLERSARDLFLLQLAMPEGRSIAAGVPWFATLFGRDALITSAQTLMLDPAGARDTLRLLAHFQGKEDNPWRDEQPGKILHEIRRGEIARCQEIPHTPYYGTIDATPLWLMLLAEYFAWTADIGLVKELWPHALAALGWIERMCREQPPEIQGYLAYQRQSRQGLANQGWKDSDDCIVTQHGMLAQEPIALCEVQGYVYASRVRMAWLARHLGEDDLARDLEHAAQNLKERFNRDFWLVDQDYCALALDGKGQAVASITSNPGHCLSTGILTPQHARAVAERLTAPDLFSGWGVRTLNARSAAYNPIGYHTGTVWPHDNAIIAHGLRMAGQVSQMLEVGSVLFEVAQNQRYYRLPELFCGFTRTDKHDLLASYPVACSPQAWAAGSLFQVLQAIVNLVPDAPSNRLRIIEPVLPDWMTQLEFRNLQVGTSVLDLEFERTHRATACRVTNKRGNIRVIIES
ncbi:amylo-alpha-1,6-glucosidase [Anthocerotibacter panamensis]|uniref:amylo-alpha-1,6-glucosidase n=1 Tax=Anthocerotibacter panamensis TaxID=2857077 RepID=UPI001C40154C|nr:amylo-alpha-1,6-glucosidase [Anthocerotibacter panamensis]